MRMRRQEDHPRPYIPPLAAAAVGMCASCAWVSDRAWALYVGEGPAGDASRVIPPELVGSACYVLAGGLFVAALGLVLKGRHAPAGYRYLRASAIGALLGAVATLLWTQGMWSSRASLRAAPVSLMSWTVMGDASPGSRGYGTTLESLAAGSSVRVRATFEESLPPGSHGTLIGRVRAFSQQDDDWARSRFMKGEVASLTVVMSKLQRRIEGVPNPIGAVRASFLDVIRPSESDARALIAGVLCGRTTELNEGDVSDAFSKTGLTHLVAVSGGHLALIASLLEVWLSRTRLRSVKRSLVLIIFMVAYVIFTGCSPSAVRSVAMVGASLAARLFARRAHALSGLSLAVIGILTVSPASVWDLGFQLSALSVAFIALFSGYVSALFESLRFPGMVGESLSLTLVAQWATLPITVPVFDTLSLIAPIANIAAGPMMSALLMVSIVSVPISALFQWQLPVLVAEALASCSIFAARLFSSLPFAAIALDASSSAAFAAYGAAAIVYALWFIPSRWMVVTGFGILALVLGVPWARWMFFAPASITIMDVGQADAILIREGSSTLLVDAGVDEAAARALARNHVLELDAVVITHWDRDHWGGLPNILETVPVGQLIVAAGAAKEMPGELSGRDMVIHEVMAGDTLAIGGFTARAIWPNARVSGLENGDSLCLAVSYKEGAGAAERTLDALLTGDTEIDQERSYADLVPDIDVLKLGHHGSKVSIDGELLGRFQPELCIASAGEGNSYGHPSRECRDAVRASGAAFLSTIDAGDVTIYPDQNGVRVATQRGPPPP